MSESAEILDLVIALLKKKGIDFHKLTIKERVEIEQLAGCEEALTDEDVDSCRGFRRKKG